MARVLSEEAVPAHIEAGIHRQETRPMSDTTPSQRAQRWLDQFGAALATGKPDAFSTPIATGAIWFHSPGTSGPKKATTRFATC
jgi:hypothetical protein